MKKTKHKGSRTEEPIFNSQPTTGRDVAKYLKMGSFPAAPLSLTFFIQGLEKEERSRRDGREGQVDKQKLTNHDFGFTARQPNKQSMTNACLDGVGEPVVNPGSLTVEPTCQGLSLGPTKSRPKNIYTAAVRRLVLR